MKAKTTNFLTQAKALETPTPIAPPSAVIATINVNTKERISTDLKYWQVKLAHFEKTHNREGIKVAKLMLDKYLDDYSSTAI